MGFSGEKWKGDDSADGNWREGFSRLDWRDQAEIQQLADDRFGGDIVEAMKFRFKGQIAYAMSDVMPKNWQLYSPEELTKMRQEQSDVGFQVDFGELLEGLEDFDPEAPLGEDEELKRWNK